MMLKETIEIHAFKCKEGGVFNRSDRRGASNALDDGHLAQKILGPQNRKHCLAGLRHIFDDFHGPGTDNKHPIAGFAFHDDDVAPMKHRFFDGIRDFG